MPRPLGTTPLSIFFAVSQSMTNLVIELFSQLINNKKLHAHSSRATRFPRYARAIRPSNLLFYYENQSRNNKNMNYHNNLTSVSPNVRPGITTRLEQMALEPWAGRLESSSASGMRASDPNPVFFAKNASRR